MGDDSDWIRGRDAFQLLIKVGSIGSAAARLREPCARGRIRARALDGTLTLRHGHGTQIVQDWEVPKQTWGGDPNNSSFLLNEGLFSSTDFTTGYRRVELSGLQFSRSDLVAYFGIEPASPSTAPILTVAQPNDARKGRGVDTEKWGTLIAAIVAFQHSKGIDLAWTASAFHDKLKEYVCERGGKDSDIPHYSKCSNALNRAIWWAAGREGEPDKI